jgi:hypothetical protein
MLASSVAAIYQFGCPRGLWDCRYISMENYEDMKASISDYKELYKWIKDSLLK